MRRAILFLLGATASVGLLALVPALLSAAGARGDVWVATLMWATGLAVLIATAAILVIARRRVRRSKS